MKQQTIKRTFTVRGETKDLYYVEIATKDGEDRVAAALPKNQIKITNREYGWGGAKSADVEFPVSLLPLFQSIYKPSAKLSQYAAEKLGWGFMILKFTDNEDGTVSLAGYDKDGLILTGTPATIKALLEPRWKD